MSEISRKGRQVEQIEKVIEDLRVKRERGEDPDKIDRLIDDAVKERERRIGEMDRERARVLEHIDSANKYKKFPVVSPAIERAADEAERRARYSTGAGGGGLLP